MKTEKNVRHIRLQSCSPPNTYSLIINENRSAVNGYTPQNVTCRSLLFCWNSDICIHASVRRLGTILSFGRFATSEMPFGFVFL